MLKVAPPEMNVVSSGPPSPIASFNPEQGYFDPSFAQGKDSKYHWWVSVSVTKITELED